MKRNHYDLERLTREEATADLLGSLDSIDTNPIPLIYQSGYLTIKSYDSEFGTYRLGFPNQEVERGFSRFCSEQNRGELFLRDAPGRELEGGGTVMKSIFL